MNTVNICGVPHTVREVQDKFDCDMHFGQINYAQAEILINEGLTEELKKETIFHEVLHGVLVHIGYQELSNDEQFVQGLANALYQTFEIKSDAEAKISAMEQTLAAEKKAIRALREQVYEMKLSKKENGSCQDCFFEPRGEDESPCVDCQNRYVSKFKRKDV